MVGGGVVDSNAPASAPDVAQLAAASMITKPVDGSTISDEMPEIKANLATMGDLDPTSVQMRISGFGLVPANYDPKTKTISYKVTRKLRPGHFTVPSSLVVRSPRPR